MEELKHYGVKGMKWGVRRYQNYDGSYTQKGLKRFKSAEARYDEADTKRKAAKEAGNKEEVRKQKVKMRNAHNEMNKAYHKLKRDKLADEGKRLYSEGKRMSPYSPMRAAVVQGLVNSGSIKVANTLVHNGVGKQKAAAAGALIATGGTAVNAYLYASTRSKNKKLSAFYTH